LEGLSGISKRVELSRPTGPPRAFRNEFPDDAAAGIRLYTLGELQGILEQRGLTIVAAYGAYDTSIPASDDQLMLVVCSHKERTCA